MKKSNKHFYLYEDTINGIKEYADKNRMTASEVIEMLWETFQAGNSDKTDVIIDKVAQRFENLFTGFRLASRQSEKNTAVIIQAVNTLAVKMNCDTFVSTDKFKSPVIAGSEKYVRDKIAGYKQNADFKNTGE
jgi:hypothetical protein